MDDHVLAELGPEERKLLAVFARHGRDGRAITTASLAAHAGFTLDRRRLSEALGKLAGRGLITEGGDDPFIGSPVAYRLVRLLPARGAEAHSTEATERHAKRGRFEKAIAAGCDEFDATPIEFDRLVATLRRLLAHRR